MKKESIDFAHHKVNYFFNADSSAIESIIDTNGSYLFITDENVYESHSAFFRNKETLIISAGEAEKNFSTIIRLTDAMLEKNYDRQTILVGVGGGVVTDITGFVASIYKRGIKLILVPTTLLAMVDASIGGKNGINSGVLKNMLGTIYQPEAIFFDYHFLSSLPLEEWRSGMAEIIKHACIRDAAMFLMLENADLNQMMQDKIWMASIIERNVAIKSAVVQKDQMDREERHLLNFGHTLGHAIEQICKISHGEAVAIGMVAACKISESLCALNSDVTKRLIGLLKRYDLPTTIHADNSLVMQSVQKDKKMKDGHLQYVLLESIGKAVTKKVDCDILVNHYNDFLQ